MDGSKERMEKMNEIEILTQIMHSLQAIEIIGLIIMATCIAISLLLTFSNKI